MQYSISKELLEHRYMAGYGRLDCCSMFTVSSQDKVIGKFFHSDTVSFIGFGECDIRIEYIYRFLRSKQYPIIDQMTNQTIGRYDRKEKTSEWTPYGKLFLGDQVYKADKINEGVSLFDKQIKVLTIQVGNPTQWVNYSVQIRKPKYWFIQTLNHSRVAFEGEIELTGHQNLMLLFASIFLLQQALEFEDLD